MNNPVIFKPRILIPLAVVFIALSAYLLTSILSSLQPIRFGTQAQWDMMELTIAGE